MLMHDISNAQAKNNFKLTANGTENCKRWVWKFENVVKQHILFIIVSLNTRIRSKNYIFK